MRYVVTAHELLPAALPDFVEVVTPTGPGRDPGAPARWPELAGRQPLLGGYAGLFGLRRLIAEGAAAPTRGEQPTDVTPLPMVGVAHERRFALTRPTSRVGVDGVLPGEELARLPRDLLVPREGTLVFSSPGRLPDTVLRQFARRYDLRDLLLLLGLAIDLEIVDDERVREFLAHDVVVPHPAVGVHPEGWLVSTLTSLERLADAFVETFGAPEGPTGQRSIAPCLEQVHVMLLEDLVRGWSAHAYVACEPVLVGAATPAERTIR